MDRLDQRARLDIGGRDLEQRGIVDESADVFLLRLDELFAVYEGSMSRGAAREVIARRGVLHEGYRKLKAPARFATTGVDYSPEELTMAGWRLSDDATQAPAGTVLNGTPSSPGVVTGRAVVVEKPEDFSSGILVAYRTDPGWVAALPFASALLIEFGHELADITLCLFFTRPRHHMDTKSKVKRPAITGSPGAEILHGLIHAFFGLGPHQEHIAITRTNIPCAFRGAAEV